MADIKKEEDVVLVSPPIILTILPIAAGLAGLYIARKQGNKWTKSLLLGAGATVIGSMPTWIWAYNINKQYKNEQELKNKDDEKN